MILSVIMAIVYSYASGLPIVPYYSTLPSMCTSSEHTKQTSYQSVAIKRGELLSSGYKTLSSPMGLLTPATPPANGQTDSGALPGSCGIDERAEKQLATGRLSPAIGRGEAKKTGHRSKSEREGSILKFGIDRILGVSGTERREKRLVEGTGSIQLPVPVFPCNVWRNRSSGEDEAHSPGYTERDGTRHSVESVLEAGHYTPGDFRLPSTHFCQTCYQGKNITRPNACELWSYAHHQQYAYRYDVNRLDTAKDTITSQILAAQQAPSAAGVVPNARLPSSRRKRSWSRAVFTSLQRKGLEKRFEMQKYVNKPDRRQLAAALGLTDAQVKVWFQNRRMKWRHFQRLQKQQQQEQQVADTSCPSGVQRSTDGCSGTDEES